MAIDDKSQRSTTEEIAEVAVRNDHDDLLVAVKKYLAVYDANPEKGSY